MNYKTRKLVKPEDLNARQTLFGGACLKWIDEEAAIFAICQLGTKNIVTKFMSEINFMSPGYLGDIIEIGAEVISFGTTSITLAVDLRNKDTGNSILKIDKIVFVAVDENGKPTPHGKKEVLN